MGAVIGATGVVSMERAREALEVKLGAKFKEDPALHDLNIRAMEIGQEMVQSI
jgi:2-oxoglutarate ferredoxin oxidoreductase subunit gamma